MRFLSRNKTFLQEVEYHQQAWGAEVYKGKPTLEQLMTAKVVAFWYPSGVDEMKTMATIHKNLNEIDEYITHLVWHTRHKLPSVRLASVWIDQQEVQIKGVKILFEKNL